MPTKEHYLLMTGESVKGIREGRKTQTRRVPVERYRNWQVGDMIWVRETFKFDSSGGAIPYTKEWINLRYKSDSKYKIFYFIQEKPQLKGGGKHGFKWQPSIHMPKWATRIWLEITGLRVERVQNISESDIISEGCPEFTSLTGIDELYAARQWWWNVLWESINAKRGYGWDKNPQVKIIEFKRIEETH